MIRFKFHDGALVSAAIARRSGRYDRVVHAVGEKDKIGVSSTGARPNYSSSGSLEL